MGKICPKCNYHIPDNTEYYNTNFGCQHDFQVEEHITDTSSVTLIKRWRCKKCLETKTTYN